MKPIIKIEKFIIIVFVLINIIITITSCEIDHGIAPVPGKLAATVYFRGTPPENTQGIYMIVAPVFPPHAINEMYHSPNSLPIDKDTVYTEMDLPYGYYEAVCLWWYSTETESNLSDILALPLDPGNNLLPLSFNITEENPIFKIELYANWDRVNRDATIEGTIYFSGQFPSNTLVTAVAAYKYKPVEHVDYLVWLKSIDFSVNENPYHYRLPIHHGTVEYIAVYWLPERADLTDFQTIGVYEDPNTPEQPGKLGIQQKETITGIDIYADWSVIKP